MAPGILNLCMAYNREMVVERWLGWAGTLGGEKGWAGQGGFAFSALKIP